MMECCDYGVIGEDENIRRSEERAGIAGQDKYPNNGYTNFVVFTDR